MKNLSITSKILIVCLIVFLLASIASFFVIIQSSNFRTRAMIKKEALLVIEMMDGTKSYLSDKVFNHLSPEEKKSKIENALNSIFFDFAEHKEFSKFTYREITINSVSPFLENENIDHKILNHFIRNPTLHEVSGYMVDEELNTVFYIARPLLINKELYGAKLIQVPASLILEESRKFIFISFALFLFSFLLSLFSVYIYIQRTVIKRLTTLATSGFLFQEDKFQPIEDISGYKDEIFRLYNQANRVGALVNQSIDHLQLLNKEQIKFASCRSLEELIRIATEGVHNLIFDHSVEVNIIIDNLTGEKELFYQKDQRQEEPGHFYWVQGESKRSILGSLEIIKGREKWRDSRVHSVHFILKNYVLTFAETIYALEAFKHKTELVQIKSDLELARTVQAQLLLPKEHRDSYFKTCSFYTSATQTAGDWFDISEEGERLFVFVGDVSGHGTASALLTAAVLGTLRSMLRLVALKTPEESILFITSQLQQTVLHTGLFMSLCGFCFDRTSMTGFYLNMGHNAPILLRQGDAQLLLRRSDILGVEEKAMRVFSFPLEKGCRVFIYTDGLIENKGNISVRALKTFLKENTNSDLETFKSNTKDHFIQGSKRKDDATFLIIEVL